MNDGFEATELPDGWNLCSLADGIVLNVQTGFACGFHNRDDEGIAHFRPMNVNEEGRIDLKNIKYVPRSEVDREERLLRSGDVLFNNTNSPELVGKTACYREDEPRAFSNHMTRIRCNTSTLEPTYCAFALHHLWQLGFYESVCNNHVSQASISREVLLNTTIPLPPLAEQKRIVAKVEMLLAHVNGARQRLAQVPVLLKRFRQSVLAAACSGRLTEDWRELAIGGQGQSHAIEAFDDDYELGHDFPLSWQLRKMIDAAEYLGGYAFSSKRFITTGVNQVLRIGNVRPGYIDVCNAPVYISDQDAQDSKRFRLETDDVLISMTGTRYKRDYGFVGLVPQTDRLLFLNQRVCRLRSKPNCLSRYLLLWMQTAFFRDFFFKDETGNVNQGNVGANPLKIGPIAIPSLAEQHEIVRRVNALFERADRIEKRLASTTQRVETLTQAILAQAFRGELIPTEAELAQQEGRDYEPAAVLLERVRKERSTVESVKNTRRSK